MTLRRRTVNKVGWGIGLISFLFLLVIGQGNAAASADLSRADQLELERVERYLNELTTVKARFTQLASTGEVANGTFYLSRPGRMRLEYDPPIPFLYVADGFWLTFFDTELGQRNDVPLGRTLADFITREDLTFTGDVTVTSVKADDGGVIVDLVLTEDPGQGTLSLVFDKRPLSLSQWHVADAQGTVTQVLLDTPEFGVNLPNRLFIIPNDN
ncbi:MAG: outer membrane lipoprotein carrier protein LolA [Pseudomonadota bacterium]